MDRLNDDYLERLIIKTILSDMDTFVVVATAFEPAYFADPHIRKIFSFCKDYLNEYKETPEKEAIINSFTENTEGIKNTLEEIDTIEFDIAGQYNYLRDQINDFLKEKALKEAVLKVVDIINDQEQRGQIEEIIKSALIKDLNIDMGTKYFGDFQERFRKIFNATQRYIPTGYPILDEFLNGGFIPLSLSVITAKVHMGKSNLMANFAARQVMNGFNPVVVTLEMSEEAFAQRFDSILNIMDINKMYTNKKSKAKLIRSMKDLYRTEGRGEIFIKQFPTGKATIHDIEAYLRELKMRNHEPDILYVDYVNLMKSIYQKTNDLYAVVKSVSEELRALSFDFKIPVVSVSQLNRAGMFVNFKDLDFSYIAESIGLAATADFLAIMGTDEDNMIYKNEIWYKIVKNRFGGRVGQFDKLYFDARTLKYYDSSEMDLWMNDARISNDSRQTFEREDQ